MRPVEYMLIEQLRLVVYDTSSPISMIITNLETIREFLHHHGQTLDTVTHSIEYVVEDCLNHFKEEIRVLVVYPCCGFSEIEVCELDMDLQHDLGPLCSEKDHLGVFVQMEIDPLYQETVEQLLLYRRGGIDRRTN